MPASKGPVVPLRSLAAALLSAVLCATSGRGESPSLKDPQDGHFDLSEFLQSHAGFLPVPVIVTEPAVGFGGGLAPVFIKRPAETAAEGPARYSMPTIYGAAGFYTDTASWGAGGFYLLPISQDRFRWTGGAAYANLNLKFYGFGADSPLQQNPVRFDIKTAATLQRLQARIPSTDFLVGLQYLFLSTKSRFSGELPPEITPRELDINVGGLGGMLEYDTRDNFLSPQRGLDLFGEATAYEPAFGSDSGFGKMRFQAVYYGRPVEHWGYGFRVDVRYAWGDMPFFMRPALDMRGLTAGKYLDKVAVLAEGEPRYWIDERWMLLAFGGAGKVAPSWDALSSSDTVWAAGFGFRYLIARKLGLLAGLDFGFGPSGQHAVYIQVGSAWR
jgi:hypothetical protein